MSLLLLFQPYSLGVIYEPVGASSYIITGAPAELKIIEGEAAGSYTITGANAALLATRQLLAVWFISLLWLGCLQLILLEGIHRLLTT